MPKIIEINSIDELKPFREDWARLLIETPGATFFQSFEWLETYWNHFGTEKVLRTLIIFEANLPRAIVPLVVQSENTRVGHMRVLTYPLDNWGSFYGPIGPDPGTAIKTAMEYIQNTRRNWDMIELRWLGAPDTDPQRMQNAMREAGYQAYSTIWEKTAVVDFSMGWDKYLSTRKGFWMRRMRQSQEKLSRHAKVSYIRCRPAGAEHGDGDPHWDIYDSCEDIAGHSWQAGAEDGTTLSHASIRAFLRELHAAAAAAGAVDMNLLMLDDKPAAFIYGYYYRGQVYGLRRGFDAQRSRAGSGAVLLWRTLEDSAKRGDRMYDMGIGSLESKRHFQNNLLPIYRLSHFPRSGLYTQLLRFDRWWESCPLIGVS